MQLKNPENDHREFVGFLLYCGERPKGARRNIENYFSMLKSRLQKYNGLKYVNLKENIKDAIEKIPKSYYRNILEGAYNRKEKYINKHNKTRKNSKKKYK